jgi:hypothetical protein
MFVTQMLNPAILGGVPFVALLTVRRIVGRISRNLWIVSEQGCTMNTRQDDERKAKMQEYIISYKGTCTLVVAKDSADAMRQIMAIHAERNGA